MFQTARSGANFPALGFLCEFSVPDTRKEYAALNMFQRREYNTIVNVKKKTLNYDTLNVILTMILSM